MAFYRDYLGFRVAWEHRFADDLPLYLEINRDGCVLHLSEHHGDACPGAAVRIQVERIHELDEELKGKSYRYARPSLDPTPWGTLELDIKDPFGNRVVFYERTES